MAKKSQPLSLEDLLEAQQRFLSASNLTEEQRKRAEDQIAKLEEMRKATTETQKSQEQVVEQVQVMTRAKGDSKNVTLGDVRTEIKAMRKDLITFAGTAPNPDRQPLVKPNEADIIDVDVREVPDGVTDETKPRKTQTASEKQRTEKLEKIGSTLGEKAELYQKGAGKEVTMAKNTEAFERFVAETKKKDELLKDANDDQIKLFGRLEDTLIKLRDADAKNSVELRKELAKIAGELETTKDTKAKQDIGSLLDRTRDRARSGRAGDKGNLGDAWSALTGKKTVLKEGYEFDPRLKSGMVRGPGGQTANLQTAGMGRIAGAAKLAGNFFRSKVEDYNAQNASNAGSDFLDRTFGGNRLEEDRARLGARSDALAQKNEKTAQPRTSAVPRAVPDTARAARNKTTAPTPMGGKVGSMTITAAVVNLRGPLKLPGSSGPNWSAGNAGAGANKDWPAKPTVTPTTPAPMAAAAKPEEDSGGFSLPSLPDLNILGRGKSILSSGGKMLGRAGSGMMSMGRGALSVGKNLLGKVPGGALKGGIAALGGAALSYGGDKLKEAGYEKTGAAADIAGQAASWGGTGAMIGSVIPGLGTAVGAGVGAVAGGAYGLYKNWGSLFGGKKSDSGGATVTPTTNAASGASTPPLTAPTDPAINTKSSAAALPLATEQKKASAPPVDMPRPAPKVTPVDKPAAKETDYTKDPRYQKLYEEQDAARKENYVKLYGEDIGGKMAAMPMSPTEQRSLDAATKERYMPVPNTQAVKKVDELSKSNAAVKDTSNKPIVIQQPAPAQAPAPAPAPQTFMPRGQVRSSESAMERYANRNSHFY